MIHQQKSINERLYDAVMNNKTAEALSLIKLGADVNFKNNSSWSMLHGATSFENTAVMQALIDQGADLEAKDQEEWTPLTYAAESDKLTALRALLKNGANIDVTSLDKDTPLVLAVDHGLVEITRELLQHGAKVNLADDETKWTPLFYAAFHGGLQILQLVIDAGADLNHIDESEQTALQIVAVSGNTHARTMALLFEYSTQEQIENALALVDRNKDNRELTAFSNSYRAQQRLNAVVSETATPELSEESTRSPARLRL